jgi:hypothetical protein
MSSDGPSGRKSHGRPDSRIFAAALASRACRKANERCATTTPCSLAERVSAPVAEGLLVALLGGGQQLSHGVIESTHGSVT